MPNSGHGCVSLRGDPGRSLQGTHGHVSLREDTAGRSEAAMAFAEGGHWQGTLRCPWLCVAEERHCEDSQRRPWLCVTEG